MGRNVSTDLQNLLDLASCETQTTLDIYPVSGDPLCFTTMAGGFTHDDIERTDDLRSTSEIKQSIGSGVNRVSAILQNVDKIIGGSVTDESLVKAKAVVGRFFRDENGVLPDVWEELFQGQIIPGDLNQEGSQNEILSDLVAAGFCVASDSLAENCQLPYKGSRCGYAGAAASCNKKRKSPDGCSGKTDAGDDETHEYAFGGMEYPDIQVASTPTGGGVGGGGTEHKPCPREDQWIPTRRDGGILMRRAIAVFAGDWLYCPKCRDFHRVKSAEMVENVEIWKLSTTENISGHSSIFHPVYPHVEHEGVQVRSVSIGDDLLTWHRENDTIETGSVEQSCEIAGTGNVVRIELDCECKTYAYGDRQDAQIVCHNSIPLKNLD